MEAALHGVSANKLQDSSESFELSLDSGEQRKFPASLVTEQNNWSRTNHFLETLVLTMLLACNAHGISYIVVGDSISARHGSWANFIRDDGVNIKLLAQGGRTIRDYDLPRDLIANPDYRNVIYFLGTNDIIRNTPNNLLKRQLSYHLHFLQDRGFTVTVVLPTIYPGYKESSKRIRQLLRETCLTMDLLFIDLFYMWDFDWTLDNYHPTPEGHRVIVEYLSTFLPLED